MIIDSEEKAKIAMLTAIGTVLLCDGRFILGGACFSLMLPWSALARVGAWLAHPVIAWRTRHGKSQEDAA